MHQQAGAVSLQANCCPVSEEEGGRAPSPPRAAPKGASCLTFNFPWGGRGTSLWAPLVCQMLFLRELISPSQPLGGRGYHAHFTDEETRPKVKGPATNGRTGRERLSQPRGSGLQAQKGQVRSHPGPA